MIKIKGLIFDSFCLIAA